ncbi:hypothetical protein [Bradyrhizobium sp. BWA-3-5]|uniref:hypothetical protein n=1 Tax=Bradyrhizobium sp. BWA-3-5 TaxID=3080013 RepID=UPI00293ED1DE|nr:hypothetical protein [Bradyrhizobium sp. BWA-3-5]WOH66034.1 hypothetical protein RX331_36905 [Bradyrhizobium sp. BWA-3-5]
MKGQYVFFAVLMTALSAALLPIGAPAAQVKECSARVPAKAQGHWSWRLIDGRKCWYAGKIVIPKSALRWPATTPAQAKAPAPAAQAKATEAITVGVVTEKRSDPLNARAQMTDDADSFESRWQARARGL